MQVNEASNDFQRQVLERPDKLTFDIEKVSNDVSGISFSYQCFSYEFNCCIIVNTY